MNKRAVVVASSAAPALIARFSTGIVKQLRQIAECLGARKAGSFFVGFSAMKPRQELGTGTRNKARRLGKKLVS